MAKIAQMPLPGLSVLIQFSIAEYKGHGVFCITAQVSYIGGTLLIQQRMFGIVEVGEKPDPVWDDPSLERLYLRLEDV